MDRKAILKPIFTLHTFFLTDVIVLSLFTVFTLRCVKVPISGKVACNTLCTIEERLSRRTSRNSREHINLHTLILGHIKLVAFWADHTLPLRNAVGTFFTLFTCSSIGVPVLRKVACNTSICLSERCRRWAFRSRWENIGLYTSVLSQVKFIPFVTTHTLSNCAVVEEIIRTLLTLLFFFVPEIG